MKNSDATPSVPAPVCTLVIEGEKCLVKVGEETIATLSVAVEELQLIASASGHRVLAKLSDNQGNACGAVLHNVQPANPA